MMLHWMRGFPATVNLREEAFWDLYYRLKEVRLAIVEATKIEGRHILMSSIEIFGETYPRDQIYEALDGFEQYIAESGASSSEYDSLKAKMQNLDGLEWLFLSLETAGQLTKIHTPCLEFKVWESVLPLIGAFQAPEYDQDNEPNDWSPPENFQNGTDDEREIWNAYHGKKD